MPIHFEPNLKHQIAAINAVIRVFEGAHYTPSEDKMWSGDVSSNVLHVDAQTIHENVATLALEHGIGDFAPTDKPDFTIEMETGTGKTYVYLRTIFQLYKEYGLHKFMIVVPSVAVREGVLSTIRDTRQHFWEIYGVQPFVVEYKSKHLADVKSFCSTNHLSIMVMNKQAFDSDSKIINAEDRDSGNLLEQLQRVQPAIIMDEPQEGMDTPNMQKRLAGFNPLFKLRYSATHRNPKNIINRLTPYEAYNSGLVKKISVLSIYEKNTQSNVAMKFRRVNLSSGAPTATIMLNVRLKSGEIKEKPVTLRRLDNLAKKTNNPIYNGWTVENIGTTDIFGGDGFVRFHNGKQIHEGDTLGADKEEIFRQQIRYTIQNHFQRKQQLIPLKIKPIALFFIDRVANYIESDGLILRLFIEEYTQQYLLFYGKASSNIEDVHGGYFAKTAKGEFTDHKRSMEGEGSKAVYDRILREKMQLLSFDDPLEFIFSHSALGVGWDNPNVFTICTLNESISQVKKRQEIGRGLRLCIDQNGKRYRDSEETPDGKEVNRLTVVPNESYRAFVQNYQTELQEEFGKSIQTPTIQDDNRTPVKIKRVENRMKSQHFVQLWDRISRQTKYRVYLHEPTLIEKSVQALSNLVISKNEINISLHSWSKMSNDVIEDTHLGTSDVEIKSQYPSMNFIEEISRNTLVCKRSIIKILSQLPDEQISMLLHNPMQFIVEAVSIFRTILNNEMVRLVRYEETGKILSLSNLFEIEEETKRDLTPTPNRGLYDYVIHDSAIEKNMTITFDSHSTVLLFFKLPKSYKVPTPIGNYTPDFALVMEKRDLHHPEDKAKYYFVIETKGTGDLNNLKSEERLKIQFALKHFEALGMEGYLAPINNTTTFDQKAIEAVGETFFDL
ncbi:MAG: DEAD/DEAH box helicase family protein [Bacteroidetes bacterium]|nr:DEAD/DEAH box helicase family protein [Bacteroidota bacterium]